MIEGRSSRGKSKQQIGTVKFSLMANIHPSGDLWASSIQGSKRKTWMGKGHGGRTWKFDEKLDLGSHNVSIREETHWLQMGVQGQVQGIWYTWQVQSMISCKRILSARRHWLWGEFFSYSEDEHYSSCSSHDNTKWLEGPCNGYEECLPKWRFGGRGIHVSTIEFSGFREGAFGLQIEEGSIWFEIGT